MGAAWCRERIEQAQNSKSPVDRIITRCSNVINAKTNFSKPNQSKPANDIVFKHIRYVTSHPVPVHRVPPGRTQNRATEKSGEWQDIPLHVPDETTPVPPPRRRKKRKVNSLEVLNSQLDKIYESSHNLRILNDEPLQQPLFGNPLPADDVTDGEPPSPTKSPDRSERKRKSRAKKIMDSKTKFIKKDTLHQLSLASNGNDDLTKDDWPKSPKMVKNVSTISLPSYQELAKHRKDSFPYDVDKLKSAGPKRNISTISLPGDSVLTAISGVTLERLEAYMRRCKSFASLKPQQLLEKLEEINNKQESESSDSWSGLDDWDVGVIEYCDATEPPPFVPKSQLSSKRPSRGFELGPPTERLEGNSFPPTPPSLHREVSLSDSTFDRPQALNDPNLAAVISNAPPSTPEEVEQLTSEEEPKNDHSVLLQMLSKYSSEESEDIGPIPTPPRRKSRDNLRRQSYQVGYHGPKIELLSRSYSMDATIDEVQPYLRNKWQNLTISQQSLHKTFLDFLGYEDTELTAKNSALTESEINLNSSLFPVIGLQSGDKGAASASPREMEDDRKTPPPPPLPSSPPPIAVQQSTDLSAT